MRGGGLFYLPSLPFSKFLIFPSTRSGRAGPLLSGQQKVGKDWPKRAAPPLGFPLCGRARVPAAQPREGSDGTPSRLRGRSFREICEGVAAKAVSNAVPCAGAHDRQTFPNGGRRGQGGEAPNPKRWRCGGRGERARARGFPQRHRSSSREAARSSAKFTALARTWGFPKGGVQHPTLVRGFARG